MNRRSEVDPTGGRAPRPVPVRPSVLRTVVVLLVVATAGAVATTVGPAVVDQLGYERFYARTAPNGRTFRLERKVRSWLPGPTLRCVVIEPDGRRTTHALAEDDPATEPEHRIRSALREDAESAHGPPALSRP